MKTTILLLTIIFFWGSCLLAQNDPPNVKVMILGTYHMANPSLDAANIKADDVKTPKRQAEIEELTNALKQFRPTKIAVEVPPGKARYLNRYTNFLKHNNFDSLGQNEIEQIGFRLAAKMGHDTLYPIDFGLDISPPSMGALFENHPEKQQFLGQKISSIQDSLNNWTENILYKNTISHFLRFMNTDKNVEYNYSIYLDFIQELWDEEHNPGTDMLSLWFERNVNIFQNLVKVTDFNAPEERILIIFGQGHVKILKDLIEDSSFYEYEHILNYLPK